MNGTRLETLLQRQEWKTDESDCGDPNGEQRTGHRKGMKALIMGDD